MIVKAGDDSEVEHLSRCLDNVAPYVDGIFLNLNAPEGVKISDRIKKLANKYSSNSIETKWNGDFAQSRNNNFAQVPKEYTHIIWLDTDDTIDKPQKIRKVCEISQNYDAIFADYLYDRDEEGNPTTVHAVARILKNNDSHIWKGIIHETLVETRSINQGITKDFTVVHHADEERKNESLLRNVELLEKKLNDETEDPDPRTMYYLGCTYMDLGQHANAKELLNTYLTMSGWDQERGAAETKLGRMYISENNHTEAKRHFMLAIGEDPYNTEPRIEMGSLELEMKQYHKARRWLKGVETMEKNQTTLERNPMGYTFRTYLLLADTYLGMGGKWLEKALEYAQKAAKYKKKDKNIKQYVKVIKNIVDDKKMVNNILSIVQRLKKNKEDDKIKLLAESVPRELEDNPIIVRLREQEPYKWPEKSVVIMTGDTVLEEWGPWSLKEGIGGSEEAIIRLTKHLSDQGYRVVVFGKVGANAGLYEGVMWRNFWEINLDDQFDIFIGWRSPALFDKKINARKSYLWLHDVMPEGEFTEERIANFTKCIVLSKYHRSLFPMIPEEKILLSANGIDADEFLQFDGVDARDPHKMIYASSHVRGLAYLYEIWPEIKKAVPDATLDVYYGRQSYDAVHKGNPERMKWMDDMMAKAEALDDVTDHGRVSQNDILRHTFSSGLWVYPCPFPEIYPVHGDTMIETLSGQKKIRDLVGKKGFHVYSVDKNGDLSVSTVNGVFLTRKNTKLIKIGFKPKIGSNAKNIKYLTLTPDHEVMLRDGSYKQAGDLCIGESVKAFHRRKNEWGKGYDTIGVTDTEVVPEHRFVTKKFHGLENNQDVDHLDNDTHNNEPENLEPKTRSEHWKDTWSRKSEQEKREWTEKQQTVIKNTYSSEEFSKIRSKAALKMWDNRKLLSNHKVVSIENVENDDAFCMEVEPDHNFIANGIVVHNCITAIKMQAGGAVPVASNYAALDETVQFGHKQDFDNPSDEQLEKYKNALIWWLQHPEEQEKIRPEMQKWARTNTWKSVAEQWVEEFEK